MRVPYSWLREYCDPGMEPAALADRLVMTGTEVERLDQIAHDCSTPLAAASSVPGPAPAARSAAVGIA